MRSRRLSIGLIAVAIVGLTVFGTATRVVAQIFTVLHDFGGAADAQTVYGGLVRDSSGNLYGTTAYGGTYNNGAVFELSPLAGGGWIENVLYSFGSTSGDGVRPYGGLTFDAAGNLYGTTIFGGPSNEGTAFELTPTANGGWTEKVLHSFSYDTTDGCRPYSSLVLDAKGNLYGTTFECGANFIGTVFELSLRAGKWQERIVHNFGSTSGDGSEPAAGVVFDAHGNLYGTTFYGGTGTGKPCTAGSCGAVFEMKPTPGGGWTERVLYSFSNNGTDGIYPAAALAIDAAGNLYGTTSQGGNSSGCSSSGCGVIFKLKPAPNGAWKETILHQLTSGVDDGGWPFGGLTIGAGGKLYGTTSVGGVDDFGTVFELSPAGGTWSQTILHSFADTDGNDPNANIILDSFGNLYGTTLYGGTYGGGSVFEITP
jgi:uncharacterized repeat protein (TIGR03803 family)